MRQKRLLLFILLMPTLLLTIGKSTLWAQCSTCTFTAATGGSYNLTGNQTLCVTGNVSNVSLTFTGAGNKVCVAPGATWTIGSGINFSASLTIDVYGTLVANGSYSVNGTTPLAVFNIKQGGVMNTNTGGFANNIRINNEGTLNFTSTSSISNSGSFSLINGTTGVVSATATSLFLLGTNSYVENYNQMTFSNLENSESDIRNAQGATITIGRYFFNHGQVINDGLINTICGPFGSSACEFIVGDKGPGKIFSITSLGCMKVVGNTRFDGPGFINGTLEITGNLDINKPVSGNNGRIIVNSGISTIALSGAYNGTNMKFCDKNTTGNKFDAVLANNPATNVVYTVDCSPNTCGTTVAPACSLTVTATPGACNPTTNQYTVTGILSFTNVPAGTITLADDAESTLVKSLTVAVAAGITSLTYAFPGLISGGRKHILTATFSNTACAPKSLTYLSPVSCTAAACVGTNLLLNPSFEQGFPSPPTGQQTQVPPPSWIGGTADNNPNSFAAPDGYAYGFSGDNGASLCQSVSATPGSTYNLNFFAGVHAANGQTVTLSFLNGSTVLTPVKSFTTTHILDISLGGNGTFGGPYSLSGVAPAGTTQVRVCAVSGNGTGYLYWSKIDNLCLTAQTPVCSLSAVATRTTCNSATNSYTATVVVSLTNTAAGTLTVSIPGSTPISQTIAANITSFSAVFGGLISDGLSHTATVSLPGCSTTTAVYTAPASCSVAPPCNLSATVTPTACNSVSNGYGISGVITLTNSPLSQTITLTDGSFVRSLTANAGTTTITYSYSNVLSSNGLVHTLTLTSSATACSTFSTTYTAPASCTVAPPVLAVVVSTPVCNSVTNTYTATGTVSLTNAVAGSLTITNNGASLTTITVTDGQTTASFPITGVSGSTPPSHTVVASLGTVTASTTYATPASCTVCTVDLTTSTLPNGQVDTAYSQTLTTTGGTTPYTYSLLGTLPTGLTLNAGSGVVSGTPTVASTTSFTIKVTDSKSCTDVAALSITTAPAPVCSLTATATPGTCQSATNTYTVTGTVSATNTTGNQSLTIAVGAVSTTATLTGNGPVSYTLTGLISDGLTKTVSVLSSATACGSASVTYSAPASCSIAPPALAVVVGTPVCNSMTNNYTATGSVSLSNAVASTLTITDNGTTIGTVSLTAGQTTASFSVSGISNAASHTVIATLTGGTSGIVVYTAPVACTVCSTSITTTSLPNGQVSTAYSQTITTTGGTTPYTYILLGTLPAGLTLSSGGVISGTPTTASTNSFTVTVTDAKSCSDNQSLSITIAALPVCSLTATATPGICTSATNQYTVTGTVSSTNAAINSASPQSLTVSVGGISTVVSLTDNGPVSYTLIGLISDGLTKTVSVLSSATACGSASVTYTAPASCSIAPPALEVVVGTPVCNSVTNNYTATATVSLSNAVASTLTITDNGTTIGTVSLTAGQTSASFSLSGISNAASHTVIATLTGGTSATVVYTAPVACTVCSLSLTTSTLPKGQVTIAYSQTISATGGTLPYNFSVAAGTLPDGLSLNPTTGVLSGTPTISGSFPVTIVVTDARGCIASLPLSVQTDPAPELAMAIIVNSPVCNSATNTYVATGTVSLTNSPAGSLTITDNGSLVVIMPVTAGQTTANFSLTGISDGPSVQLVSVLLGTKSASTTYTTPASCTSGAPDYAIAKTVSQNRVEKGSIVTYTVSLTNIGNDVGTNLVVGDQLSRTEVTFIGSATTSTGTFVPSGNSGTWSIASLAPGQVATLSFQVQINAEGTTYNTATAPDGKTVVACLTVPYHVCANQPFEFRLTAPASLSTYQWSRDGILIPGATSAVYNTTVVGEYTVATTNSAGCADGSCCPLVIVADPAPSLSAIGVAAGCVGGSPLNNASISLVSSSTDAVSYNISLGSSFTASTPLFASNQPLSGVVGGLLLTNQANPDQAPGTSYTIRVYAANGCYSDVVVVIPPALCVCPPAQCVPIVVKRIVRR